jgi:hypothetical protein
VSYKGAETVQEEITKYQNGSFVEKKQKNDEEKKLSFMAI